MVVGILGVTLGVVLAISPQMGRYVRAQSGVEVCGKTSRMTS